MTQTLKRRISFFSALLIVAGCVAACGDEETTKQGSENPTEAVTEAKAPTDDVRISESLPQMDWGGKTFRVLTRIDSAYTQFSNFEVYAASEVGEVVNDAVFRRNSRIQERFNVKIEQGDALQPQNEMVKFIPAGDDLYDLAFVDLMEIGALGQSGYLYDLNTVKYIDFSQPWWYEYVNSEVSIKGKLFYTTSDFSLRDKNRAYILIFNPGLAQQNDIPDLVETVRDGKWTVELMMQYNRIIANDVDGDGKISEVDVYGLGMDSYNAFAAFFFGCDNRLLVPDENGVPSMDTNRERAANTVDKLVNLTCDGYSAFFCEDFDRISDDVWGMLPKIFSAGRALYVTDFPHGLQYYSKNCDFDYGVLPFPKYDESQEKYTTMADVYSMMFCIPATCKTPDFTGFMLEALSSASTYTSLRAYYDIACKTKYSYVESNAEMLDLAFGGIIYDNAAVFRKVLTLYDIIGSSIPKFKKNLFASYYAREEKKTARAIEKLIEAIDNIDH